MALSYMKEINAKRGNILSVPTTVIYTQCIFSQTLWIYSLDNDQIEGIIMRWRNNQVGVCHTL